MVNGIIGQRIDIRVDTRLGNPVVNFQSADILGGTGARDEVFRRRFPDADPRTGPSGYYNCHGMTFASRRTAIEESEELTKILREDDYEEVPRERVLPGDIVIYYGEGDNDPEHSGVVIESPTQHNLWIPRVYSKWGGGSEFIHLAPQCPYSFRSPRYYRVHR